MATVIERDTLPHSATAYQFQGEQFDEVGVSFFMVDAPPGSGPQLHTHPYTEVFIIHDGTLTFTVGNETIEASAGQIVIVPPNIPHKFTNTGTTHARHTDIHTANTMQTTWLEP